MPSHSAHGEASLVWIGGYKLVQGLLLAVVATGLLAGVNHDLQDMLGHWVKAWHFDADNRYSTALLHKAGLVDDQKLKQIGGLSFAYGAVFMVEGIGLVFKKRWAEYLTLVITLSFIPFEIFELAKHFTPIKLAILAVNLTIAVYLVVMLRRKSGQSQASTH
ncbi:MAG: DUF2127 domain-containing protein [Chthoniobacter sp.]|uniref:DUF2127 domain-containing protein n=1 Tax=Chthoniobacter sp. TaxID=2510640 RepID=UPI0032AD1989